MTIDTSVFARIIKQEKQEDGTLLVTGLATDDTLDIDEQICDPDWLERAMPDWFQYGNVREQHSHIAAGVATKYEQNGTQHNITVRVVDPNSVLKIEAGVLKGFSIGIRDPRIARDKAAPGGRIVDGQIVEVSLVDRPANPSCLLTLAKTVGGVMQQTETLIEKDAVMERCKECDKAYKSEDMKDGKCADCMSKAAEESSEGSSEESIPVEGSEQSEESTETSEESSAAKADMETCKECGAECKADGMKAGMCDKCYDMKAAEESSQKIGEESSQVMGEESSREGGVAGVAGKEEMSEHVENEMAMTERLVEAVARIESMLSEYVKSKADDLTEEVSKSVKAIDERLVKVEKSASRGPVRTNTKSVRLEENIEDRNAAKAAQFRAKAASTTDPALASAYLLAAAEADSTI